MKKAIVLCLLVAAAAAPARAQFASTACAPPLQPVPFFGPPNWWSGLSGTGNELINNPFDPRWSGGAKQDFGFGANPHVTLRVGQVGNALDLQFTMWVDPSQGSGTFEGVWLGLADATTGGIAGALHIVCSTLRSEGRMPTKRSPMPADGARLPP